MNTNARESLIVFVARHAPLGVIPGMWFAYVGGISFWWGALGGLAMTAAVAVPLRVVQLSGAARKKRGKEQGIEGRL